MLEGGLYFFNISPFVLSVELFAFFPLQVVQDGQTHQSYYFQLRLSSSAEFQFQISEIH